MTALDPKALHAELQDLRLKVVRGEPVTDAEIRAGLNKLFAYRSGAHTSLKNASKKKATKAATSTAKAKAKQDAANLLGDLI